MIIIGHPSFTVQISAGIFGCNFALVSLVFGFMPGAIFWLTRRQISGLTQEFNFWLPVIGIVLIIWQTIL
jgi:hypothetical protein